MINQSLILDQRGIPYPTAAGIGSSAGYAAADQFSRVTRGWAASDGSSDVHVDNDLDTLRKFSGDAYRNIPVAASAIKGAVTSIVGPGLTPQSRIDREFLGLSHDEADAWQDTAEREYRLWAGSKDCDATKAQVFEEIQGLALLSALMNGDVFAALPLIKRSTSHYMLAVQLIEGHQVSTPDGMLNDPAISGGIRRNKRGEPVSCFVQTTHPGSLFNNRQWREVQFFGDKSGRPNIIHLFERERVGQSRGFPYLSSVLPKLKQLSRLSDAELMASVVTSFLTVFVKSPAAQGVAFGGGVGPDGKPLANKVQLGSGEQAMGHGNIVDLAAGEEIELADPKRPNALFEPFFRAIVQEIGGAIEQPADVILKSFNKSYSASRAAFLMAWKFYSRRRSWLVNNFCQPIFIEFLREAVITGRIKAPGFLQDSAIRAAYCQAEWNGPIMGQLDPLKEVTASKMMCDEDFSTRTTETRRLTGGDFSVNLPQRIREEKQRSDGGLRLIEGGNSPAAVSPPDKEETDEE
ncbi:MAG: phage portal protein [Proteobacteria bacterium]|nr:phage portal protein [Pseudomonadota bacterium]